MEGGGVTPLFTPLVLLEECSWAYESQSKPGTKMVYPEPCTGVGRRISAAICGWDRPLLTFIYPGFDCGSYGRALELLAFWRQATNGIPEEQRVAGADLLAVGSVAAIERLRLSDSTPNASRGSTRLPFCPTWSLHDPK